MWIFLSGMEGFGEYMDGLELGFVEDALWLRRILMQLICFVVLFLTKYFACLFYDVQGGFDGCATQLYSCSESMDGRALFEQVLF